MNRPVRVPLLPTILAFLAAPGCNTVALEDIPTDPGYLGADLGAVAVVTGDFDRIEELLDSLDIPFTLYDGFVSGPPAEAPLFTRYAQPMPPVEQLLGNASELQRYDTVFLNCGIRGTGVVDPETLERSTLLLDDPVYAQNLRSFVENGGALLASDRSYSMLEATFPEAIEFTGNDMAAEDVLTGVAGTYTARIVDPDLRQVLENSVIEVTFENEGWATPEAAEGTLLAADVFRQEGSSNMVLAPDTPLLVQRTVGLGTITFTSFHNLPRVDQAWTDLQISMLRGLGTHE